MDGLLVPSEDVNSLTGGMKRLMSDEDTRRRMAKKAPEVLERFSVDNFLNRWEEVLNEVTTHTEARGTLRRNGKKRI